jgi:hypothetical protein
MFYRPKGAGLGIMQITFVALRRPSEFRLQFFYAVQAIKGMGLSECGRPAKIR